MKVTLVEGTRSPEDLVCKAARNDYRWNGITGYSFNQIMEPIEPNLDKHEDDIRELWYVDEDYPSTELEEEAMEIAGKRMTLIDHLMDRDHWGPFEHPQATIAMENVSRVFMAQITRHRLFTYDVMSLRYVEAADPDRGDEDTYYTHPGIEEGGIKDRHGYHEFDSEKISNIYHESILESFQAYNDLLDEDVPPEEARRVLPLATNVNIVMSGNARAWMHVVNMRGKADVQKETRDVVKEVEKELLEWMPYTFGKFKEMTPLRLMP